jgi:predicted transcriptional regulator
MTKPSPILTPPELEIMRIIWDRQEATVRDVYEALVARRKVAYTTVLTVMTVLETKGYVKRRKDERAHVYVPARDEASVERSMVHEFIDRVFAGATQPLLVHLLKDGRLSAREVQKLERAVKARREEEAAARTREKKR